MGNTDNKQNKNTQVINDSWQTVATDNGIQIMKNKFDNRFAQRRGVFIDPLYETINELQIYEMRKNNDKNFVKTYAVEQISSESLKSKKSGNYCSEKRRINVISERIPQRLSQMPQLTVPESLKVLKQSLISFETIYKKSGPIHIHSDLIGVNQNRQVRCWINQNWALNHPTTQFKPIISTRANPIFQNVSNYQQIQPHFRDEQEMVRNLLEVIQDKTQQGKYPSTFRTNLIQSYQPLNFKNTKKLLQNYIVSNNIYLPEQIMQDKIKRKINNNNIQTTNSMISNIGGPLLKKQNYTNIAPTNYSSNNYIMSNPSFAFSKGNDNNTIGPTLIANNNTPTLVNHNTTTATYSNYVNNNNAQKNPNDGLYSYFKSYAGQGDKKTSSNLYTANYVPATNYTPTTDYAATRNYVPPPPTTLQNNAHVRVNFGGESKLISGGGTFTDPNSNKYSFPQTRKY